MSAQRLLSVMQTLTTMESKITDYEDTVDALLRKIATLEESNRAQRIELDRLFKTTLCRTCSQYLDSKRNGDTVEGYSCNAVFLHRCPGIAP